MQPSTQQRRTAHCRSASGGVVGKMLNNPPHLRGHDAPTLSQRVARSNIKNHHQKTISCSYQLSSNAMYKIWLRETLTLFGTGYCQGYCKGY